MKTNSFWPMAIMALWLGASSVTAAPLETTFTYQGELTVSGQPANGEFDLRFELYDANMGGAQAGSTLVVEDALVSDGIFSVELDFGAGPFAGDQLWIEVGVRNGSEMGGFTELLPRQKLTATPYALHAEMVPAGSIGTTEISNGSIGAIDIIASQVQRRITGSCTVGSFVTEVTSAGGVICERPPLRTGLLTVGATAFTARDSSYEVTKGFQSGGVYVSGGSGSFVGIIAPVQLPDGATVTGVRATYLDNSVDEDLQLIFAREERLFSFQFVASVSTSGADADWREIVVSSDNTVIDNANNSYFLMVLENNWIAEGNSLRIKQFDFEYTY